MTRCGPGREVAQALEAGVAALAARQRRDGAWEDYHALPVGPATGWATAFVATALFDAGGEAARAAGHRAVAWLTSAQAPAGGWGFNAATGPDADSTAWGLLALRSAGSPAPPAAAAFLASLHRPDGGYATYPRRDAWGASHPDVTPVAFLALPGPERRAAAAGVAAFALARADADGTWPAYWWRGRHYSTYWNRVLLSALGRPAPPLAGSIAEPSRTVETSFDLAWVLAAAVLDGDPPSVLHALAALLLARQRSDGSWAGGADLRVTSPACPRPWVWPVGAYFEDDAGLITTASALRALALVSGRAGHVPAAAHLPHAEERHA